MSVDPCSEKFNIESNDHGRTQKCHFAFQFVKQILQTTAHLIQYTVLELRFYPVKGTTITVRYGEISSISIHSHQVKQAIPVVNMKTNQLKMFLNVFSATYTYSNCIVYGLFSC